MSVDRSAGRLVGWYPAAWRNRYGEELQALIVDCSDGERVPWRVRADVAAAGARERLRGAGDAGGGPRLVLWAWAMFVLAGAIVAKTSEHWQSALGASGHPAATAAFTALIVVAVAAGVLVLGGIALAVPGLAAFVRAGGWPQIRGAIVTAAALTVALAAATIALSLWAHGLSARARNGHDALYGAAFLAWAALAAACLLSWTRAASATARRLSLRAATVRAHAALAPAVALAMALMTAATVVWWAVVASAAPGALTGPPASPHASPVVPGLVVAAALMASATALAAVGARRACRPT